MNKVEETATKIFEYANTCVEFGMQPNIQTILNYAWCLYCYGSSDAIDGKLERQPE